MKARFRKLDRHPDNLTNVGGVESQITVS